MGIKKFFSDVKYLWLEQVLELRSYWYWYVVVSLFIPISMTFGLSRISGNGDNTDTLTRVVIGASIFALANDAFTAMAIRIATMRRDGMISYYASLPISKLSLIVSLMLSRAMIALPGMLAPLISAPLLFGLHLTFHPLLILLIPLTSLLLSTVGMAYGLVIRKAEITQLTANILLYVLVMATPVFIPMESLPAPLRVVSLFLPFTYVADTFRMLLQNSITSGFWIDLAILGLMTVICLFVLERKLQWQSD